MTSLTSMREWRALQADAERLRGTHVRELFDADSGRAQRMTLRLESLLFDFSKQRVDDATLERLLDLARACELPAHVARLFSGAQVNLTEARPAQHVDMRAEAPGAAVAATRARAAAFAAAVNGGLLCGATGWPIRNIVNLGIGGSDLGVRLVTEALRSCGNPQVHVEFVSGNDPAVLRPLLTRLWAPGTLFVVASKSFTTPETLDNARIARDWLVERLGSVDAAAQHMVAVTSAPAAAQAFGIPPEQIFPVPEGVGGRYSVWSPFGLAAACRVGTQAFDELLAGARAMDEHFATAPLARNLPVIMALVGIWNINFLGAESLAILPYSRLLERLPAYLQQLEMESNGKRVRGDGTPVDYHTAPIVWGGVGPDSQHAFHQLLYQGTRLVPMDFIVPFGGREDGGSKLAENAFAQSAALMAGHDGTPGDGLAAHRACPGNQPSSTLLFPRLTPRLLGMLLALYEHKVYAQSCIWGINAFDQFGVELGKRLARRLAARDGGPAVDASTRALMAASRPQAKPVAQGDG